MDNQELPDPEEQDQHSQILTAPHEKELVNLLFVLELFLQL